MSSDWQHQLEKISERAKHILKTGLWSDCKFIVGIEQNKKEFKAHKLILSMASPVFDKMFNSCFQQNNEIEVVDIQPEAFAAMLSYVYTDEIQLQSFDQACELCYLGDKYMMPILVQHCIAYIWKDVNCSNACRAYEFAKLFDQQDIMEDCKEIILKQTSDIIEHSSFNDIEKETLLMILEQDELNIKSEKQLFEAVVKWAEAEFQRKGVTDETGKQIIFNEIIPKIRFLNMSPQEFAEGPAVSPFISKDDSFALLINITSSNPPVGFPKNFSKKLRGRIRELNDHCIQEELIWELKHPIETEISQETDYAFSICCDKDIKIHGLKVMGHVLYKNVDYECSLYSSDEEFTSPSIPFTSTNGQGITGYVDNQKSTLCQHTVSKSSKGFIETINIAFAKPVRIKHGKFYKLGVKVFKPSWYTKGEFHLTSLVYKSFKFDFKNNHTSLIHGIIFSY